MGIGYFDLKDTADIARAIVRQGAWIRVHVVALAIMLGAFGALWMQIVIWVWADTMDHEFYLTVLFGTGMLLAATLMLWRGLRLRPRSILFEIDGSGIVLHVSPRMRKLETPVVLSWTDIAVIRTRTSGRNEDLHVQSRDGVWHQLPVYLSSPCRLHVIDAMHAALKEQGIRTERKNAFMFIASSTEWRLSTP